MKNRKIVLISTAVFGLLTAAYSAPSQSTAFTYQGRLNSGGIPANGWYDLRFKLAADPLGNNYAGSASFAPLTPVTNGLFVAIIDFGANVFTGSNYWLEVDVRTNDPANVLAYTPLNPLQPITSAPYAIFATTASNVVGTVNVSQLSGNISVSNLTGTIPLTQLPVTVVTNGASGVNVTGTFTGSLVGNGAGLTNLNLTSVVMPPAGMALIPGGLFAMGATKADVDIIDATNVNTMVSAFYMDVDLMNWSRWQSVFFWATNHGYGFAYAGMGKAVSHPVQTVDWFDAVKWCNARSQQAAKTPVYFTDAAFTKIYTNGEVAVFPNWAAQGYRLPTEAEWEKAARGGLSGERFPSGNGINEYLANYDSNVATNYDLGPNGYNGPGSIGGTSPATSPIETFAPNGYGLYDMAGNVFEWCWDWYGTPYAGGSDPHGPSTGSARILRGGSWGRNASYCRVAERFDYPPTTAFNSIGFRTVLNAIQP